MEYENLVTQIVMQAVSDYKKVLKRPGSRDPACNREELELFFQSDWCKLLTGIDMVQAMQHIKRKAGVV